jgi:hypothetical protein
VTVDEAKQHYRIVISALQQERQKRDMFLKEPRRTEAIADMDRAIASMKALGDVLNAAKEAGLLTTEQEQPVLLAYEEVSQ